ncbi:MAG: cellulose binding domain-containing protein [Solirubrobacterales bacterium]|nr:cellulose binding domain-containing protein [Solirubrobacterales bacterium]
MHTKTAETEPSIKRRIGLRSVAVALVAVAAISATAASAHAAGSASFAPYVDMTLQSKVTNTNNIKQSGAKASTLAFIVSGAACQASWGGYYGLNASDDWFDAKQVIADARAAGSEPVISFGGASGQELARTCTNVSDLAAQYQAVIDAYNVHSLDFDIEGADQADPTSLARRFQAIARIQASGVTAGKPVTVSLTLPTMPTGLTYDGMNVLRSAISNGVNVSVVNVMAMDYYDSSQNPAGKMGDYAVQAGEALKTQLASLYPGRSDVELYRMVGITPMIGINDNPAEIFTTSDATKVLNWANAKSIGRIAMWSLNRDFQCATPSNFTGNYCSGVGQSPLQFSSIWKAFGGAPVINPTPTPTPGTAVLTAAVTKDSTWATGFCRSFKITNSGTKASANWKLTFTLPSTVRITDSWSGSAVRSGNVVTVTAPNWAASVAPGASVVAFGFCASGIGEPTALAVAETASLTATTASRSRSAAKSRAAIKAKKIRNARERHVRLVRADH